jgi:Kef-type K+ transport system membrane component KefB
MMIEGVFLIVAIALGIYTKQLWDQVFIMTIVITLINGPLSHFFAKQIMKRKGEIIHEH